MPPSILDASQISPSRAASDVTGKVLTAPDVETFSNTGKEFLWVSHDNGSGEASDLTITTHKTVDGQAVADKVVTIGAGELHLVGPFPTEIYNDADDEVTIALSGGRLDVSLWVIKPN